MLYRVNFYLSISVFKIFHYIHRANKTCTLPLSKDINLRKNSVHCFSAKMVVLFSGAPFFFLAENNAKVITSMLGCNKFESFSPFFLSPRRKKKLLPFLRTVSWPL